MRFMCAAVLAFGIAGATSAQVAWVGAGWGGSWEWQAPSAPDRTFLHSRDGVPSVFLALPIDVDTVLRLQAAELPHVKRVIGSDYPGHLRAYTVGIDYLMPGVFGQALVSAGLGSYKFDLTGGQTLPGHEETKLGWYAGVGEWFTLTRRSRVTAEIAVHHSQHEDRPTIVTASVGLAFGL
ncbi:MAG TPA: hypothetical protein VMT19_00650 [Thermoanaerobaculaceae bacterium]|nr:hypothetical protein [Thermoanaerobaculaceae bacterium]